MTRNGVIMPNQRELKERAFSGAPITWDESSLEIPGFEMEVSSTCCASVRYDPVKSELTIEFQERGTYKYYHFSLDDFAEFESSSSRGQHFNRNIRPNFSTERIA